MRERAERKEGFGDLDSGTRDGPSKNIGHVGTVVNIFLFHILRGFFSFLPRRNMSSFLFSCVFNIC